MGRRRNDKSDKLQVLDDLMDSGGFLSRGIGDKA